MVAIGSTYVAWIKIKADYYEITKRLLEKEAFHIDSN